MYRNVVIGPRNAWVSVEDQLPPKDPAVYGEFSVSVLIINVDNEMEVGWCDLINRRWYVNYDNTKNITHWMPLPEPPA